MIKSERQTRLVKIQRWFVLGCQVEPGIWEISNGRFFGCCIELVFVSWGFSCLMYWTLCWISTQYIIMSIRQKQNLLDRLLYTDILPGLLPAHFSWTCTLLSTIVTPPALQYWGGVGCMDGWGLTLEKRHIWKLLLCQWTLSFSTVHYAESLRSVFFFSVFFYFLFLQNDMQIMAD